MVGWCSASPNSATLLTGDRLPSITNQADLNLVKEGFQPTLRIWDAKSGKLKHSIQIMEVKITTFGHNDWYSLWLDDTHALLIWLWRYNYARAAEELQLILIDTTKGEIAKVSRIFKWAGEYVMPSPDRKLAIGRDDNSIDHCRNIYSKTHVIDLEHFTLNASWEEPRDPNDPSREVNAMIAQWSPDSKHILTVGNEHRGAKARIQNAKTGTILQTFSGHTDWIWDVAFPSKGDKLLTASEDGTVRVWNITTGKTILKMKDHNKGVKKVLILPGDSLAVSAADDRIAKIWDIETGKAIRELSDHPSAIRKLELTSNQILRTVTEFGTITDWEWSTGKS
jgi:hypothetical protein